MCRASANAHAPPVCPRSIVGARRDSIAPARRDPELLVVVIEPVLFCVYEARTLEREAQAEPAPSAPKTAREPRVIVPE